MSAALGACFQAEESHPLGTVTRPSQQGGENRSETKENQRLPSLVTPLISLDCALINRANFPYARYNADLSAKALKAAGFENVNPASIQKMDAAENMETLLAIGRKAGSKIDGSHFGPFI